MLKSRETVADDLARYTETASDFKNLLKEIAKLEINDIDFEKYVLKPYNYLSSLFL